MKRLFCVMAVSLVTVGGSAGAATLLDQDPYGLPTDGGLVGGSSSALYYRDIGQTFTVGVTGTLFAVELYSIRNRYLKTNPVLEIGFGEKFESNYTYATSVQIDLASISLATPDDPSTYRSWLRIENLGVAVKAGDYMSMTVSIPNEPIGSQGEFVWEGFSEKYDSATGSYIPEPYRDGLVFGIDHPDSPGGPALYTQEKEWGSDQVFRTFVTPPSPVPLPATLPLMLAGLAGLGWVARRKSSKAL